VIKWGLRTEYKGKLDEFIKLEENERVRRRRRIFFRAGGNGDHSGKKAL